MFCATASTLTTLVSLDKLIDAAPASLCQQRCGQKQNLAAAVRHDGKAPKMAGLLVSPCLETERCSSPNATATLFFDSHRLAPHIDSNNSVRATQQHGRAAAGGDGSAPGSVRQRALRSASWSQQGSRPIDHEAPRSVPARPARPAVRRLVRARGGSGAPGQRPLPAGAAAGASVPPLISAAGLLPQP